MGESAIHEGGTRRIEAVAVEEHGALTRAAHFARKLAGAAAPRQDSADRDYPQKIEHQRFHALDHRAGCIVESEISGPLAQ